MSKDFTVDKTFFSPSECILQHVSLHNIYMWTILQVTEREFEI